MRLEIKKIDPKWLPTIIAVAMVAVGLPLFWSNVGIVGNIILLAIVIGVVPYAILSYLEMRRVKAVEDALPVFMLDLAETQKAGLTIPDALRTVAKTDYGKLSAEIQMINNQMSWGISLTEAMERFSERMRKSDLIRRTVRIIVESYATGGDIARTLHTTAEDIITIKDAEKERKSVMGQHVAVMYAIYFIFVGIVVGLSKTLLPMLQLNVQTAALGGLLTFQDPCTICAGAWQFFCVSCSVFGTVCSMFLLGAGAVCYYRSLFLVMAIVQGICTGLVAGQIGEGSIIAGVKHSIIMTASGFTAIMIMLQLGMM